MDKTNLKRRIVELDEMVKKLFGTQQGSQQQIPRSSVKMKAGFSRRTFSFLRKSVFFSLNRVKMGFVSQFCQTGDQLVAAGC